MDAAWIAILVQTVAIAGTLVAGWVRLSARLVAIEVRLAVAAESAAERKEAREQKARELAMDTASTLLVAHCRDCRARQDFERWNEPSGVRTQPERPTRR